MSELETRIDEIVKSLVRDVAAGIHGMYRGDTRQQTTQLRLSTFAKDASAKIQAVIAATPAGAAPAAAPGGQAIAGASAGSRGGVLSPEEVAALTRCVMGWLPLGGSPSAATPDMKCVSGAREMCPSWGERETARMAVKRIASSA